MKKDMVNGLGLEALLTLNGIDTDYDGDMWEDNSGTIDNPNLNIMGH